MKNYFELPISCCLWLTLEMSMRIYFLMKEHFIENQEEKKEGM